MSTPTVPHPRTLTTEQLAHLRTELERRRDFRLDQLAELSNGSEPHGEIAESLAGAARAALRDVTTALQRIEDGSYGRCTECGHPLPPDRLEMLPQVGRCTACLRSGQE